MALPDIWRFVDTLAYALAFVVLAHAAQAGRRSWPAALTLAGLVGFLALLTTTLAPMVLVLWTVLEAATLVQCRRAGFGLRALAWSVVGPALAVLLLAVGGGTLTSALTDSVSTGLSVRWTAYPGAYRPLGSFDELPGGIALLRGGPVVIAGVAALLGRRDRLVLAFAVGACALVLASVALGYDPAALDPQSLRRARAQFCAAGPGARTRRSPIRLALHALALCGGRAARGSGDLADGRGTRAQLGPGDHAGGRGGQRQPITEAA